jgi:hypothetical protein
MENSKKFTVGQLKSHLAELNDSDELVFQNELTFYRIKKRGENLEQIEFNEVFQMPDQFKKLNQ